MMNKLSRLILSLGILQLLLVILSWLLSAMRVEGVRSLLSGEGIRWFIGGFTGMLLQPLLAWLLLLLIALGALQKSGFLSLFQSRGHWSYRQRIALRVSAFLLVVYVVIVCLLTLMPHAILLSATGALFPSAFSSSLIPIICFGIALLAISYGLVSGILTSTSSMLSALSFGLQQSAPMIILYIFFIQFYESLWFVFG